MKRLAPLLFLVCLAASLPPMPPGYKAPLLSPKDAASKSGATMATPQFVTPPPLPVTPGMFKYPPDATNYLWDIQSKTNLLQPWETLMSNCVYSPSTNNDFPIFRNVLEPQRFFRMKGHKP